MKLKWRIVKVMDHSILVFAAFSHSDECNIALSLEKVIELQSYIRLVVIYSFVCVGLKYQQEGNHVLDSRWGC